MSVKRYSESQKNTNRHRNTESGDKLFAWTVFIFLLTGFAFFCWIGSYYIFSNPEKSPNYSLLMRLHKIESPMRFTMSAAPRGEFMKPWQLMERFGSMTFSELDRSNEQLIRSFIRNYHQNRDLVPYAIGTYQVIGILPLSSKTFCPSGIVALLQGVEQPKVLLEQLFTSPEQNILQLEQTIIPGEEIQLEKLLDLSAVIHITALADNRILLTTMPLLYGHYANAKGNSQFSLEPPKELNLNAGLPVLSEKQMRVLFRRKLEIPASEPHELSHFKRIPEEMTISNSKTSSNIPIVDPSISLVKQPASLPPNILRAVPVHEPPVMAAIPLDPPVQRPEPAPKTIPEEMTISNSKTSSNIPIVDPSISPVKQATSLHPNILRAVPVHEPSVMAAIPLDPPVQRPEAVTQSRCVGIQEAQPAPIQHLLVAQATNNMIAISHPASLPSPKPIISIPVSLSNSAAGNCMIHTNPNLFYQYSSNTSPTMWSLYEPGKMPRGRLLEPSDADELLAHGIGNERYYLQGHFVVTASGNGRAVLRPQHSLNLSIGRPLRLRVIVTFPVGALLPTKRTIITHDGQHPLQIDSIMRDRDGQINIYARKIIL